MSRRSRPPAAAALHVDRRRHALLEAEAGVQSRRVAGVKAPAELALRAAVDRLADQLDAEPAAAMGAVDEHIAKVGDHGAI